MTSDYGQMASRVSDLRDNLEEEHEDATEDAMSDMRGMVQGELRRADSVARGILIGDIREGETMDYDTFVARSVSAPGWSKYLEHGTGQRGTRSEYPIGQEEYPAPSPMPPFESIHAWVVSKSITSREYDDDMELATAIQRTIGKVGTFAHPFMRPVWWGTYGRRNVINANKRAMSRALRRM